MIRSGEAPGIGWSRNMLYLGFSILPRSVVWSANPVSRSDISDVMRLIKSDATLTTKNWHEGSRWQSLAEKPDRTVQSLLTDPSS